MLMKIKTIRNFFFNVKKQQQQKRKTTTIAIIHERKFEIKVKRT